MSALLDQPTVSSESSARSASSAPERVREPATALLLHRTLSLTAAAGLFWPLFQSWNSALQDPAAGVATVALVAGTLWMICAIVVASSEVSLQRLDRWLLVLAILVLAAWGAQTLWQNAGYGTDEAAFIQGAANLLVHGHDPYGANLISSLSRFAVPPAFWTYTMGGGVVSTLGYPALPVLVTVPFLELTGGGQAVPIADLVMLIGAMAGMFFVLPKPWRGLAVVVCVAFPVLFGLAMAGDNAVLMMTPLVVVAFRWNSVGAANRLRRVDIGRAVALGLALSANQLSWFLAPFLICGIYLARRTDLGRPRAVRLTGYYLAVALATFLLINLPFILWGPGAWLSGVAAPLSQHALPYGQGLVGLTLFLRLGGGAVDFYSYAAALLYLALLVVYIVYFGQLWRCCFVLPSVALFVSDRSLALYWTALIAVLVVSVATGDQSGGRVREVRFRLRWRGRAVPRGLLVFPLFLPAIFAVTVALTAPQPLGLRIVSAHSDPSLRRVSRLHVRVRNDSSAALQPHFAADSKGFATAFWKVISGPPMLSPGRTAVYVLVAPDASSMPANSAPFVVEAVTGLPRTISSSARFVQVGPSPQNW